MIREKSVADALKIEAGITSNGQAPSRLINLTSAVCILLNSQKTEHQLASGKAENRHQTLE